MPKWYYFLSFIVVAPTPSQASPMNYPVYNTNYNQPPASPYNPGMTPGQYGMPQPMIQQPMYQAADPVENAFRMTAGAV